MRVSVKAFTRLAGLVLWVSGAVWSQPAPDAEAVLRHAMELHQAGDIAGAIGEYRAYLKLVPDNTIALSNLGAALAHARRYEEAIAEYQKALELRPLDLPALFNLGLAYYKAGEISKAVVELERVLKEQADQRQAILLLADCELRLGETKKVIDLLSPLQSESADDKEVDFLLGNALIRDNQGERGQLLVDRILRNGDSAATRLSIGEAKLSVEDFNGALQDLRKALELNPRLPDLYTYYGMALAGSGNSPAAAAAFRKELELNPNDYNSNLQLGILLKRDEHYTEARECFERALVGRPHDLATRFQMAIVDLEDGQTERARLELEELTKEVPPFLEAHVSLATAYYRLKRKEDGDRERAIVLKLSADRQAADLKAKKNEGR
jgi:tetratricopeptide (TPR) repeat protein